MHLLTQPNQPETTYPAIQLPNYYVPFTVLKKSAINQKIRIDPAATFSLENYSFLPSHIPAFWFVLVLVLQIIICFHHILMLAGFFFFIP
jgi:hypothetical protein